MTASRPLSEQQAAALKALSASTFKLASDLGFSGRTLASLANAGLADRRWFVSSLREPDRGLYRISGRGVIALRRLAK